MKTFNEIKGIIPQAVMALLPFFAHAQGIHSTPGTKLVANGPVYLVLNDAGLVNNGNFTAGNSTVVLTGNATTAGSFIGGSSPVSFYNLTIHRLSGDVQLNNNIQVSGSLAMQSGNLQLNKYTVDLGSTGSITGENNHARITGVRGGFVKATAVLNAPRAVNPGNIGVELTSTANLGTTVITRGHVPQTGDRGEQSIGRYFDIAPSIQTDAPVTLRFYYWDAELGGNDKTALNILSSTNKGMSWTVKGKDNSDMITNWVVKNNVTAANRFTLAKASGKAYVQVYPNPFREKLTVMVYSDKEKDAAISLYDQRGVLIARKQVHCTAGVSNVEWSTGQYAAGTYHLVFENLDAQNEKLIKQ